MAGRQTVERRQLGLMLKRLRTDVGASQAEAARAIGHEQTRISKIELGQGSLSDEQLTGLLDLYQASRDDRATAMSLVTQTRKRQRGRTYTDVLPSGFQRLADLEADATAIYSYETGIIPGLIQSPEYVRALIDTGIGVWWEGSGRELEGRVGFRTEQQRRVLEIEPTKTLRFAFTEDALRHIVGDRSVLRGQVLHLLNLIERYPSLGIQIMPDDAADNPLLGGGLLIMEFDGSPRIGSATVPFGPSTYYDDEDDTDAMKRAFDGVQGLSLGEDTARERLIMALKEL